MQVEFMGGPEYNIEDKIKDLMKQNDKISIAVAFLGNSGVSTIKQSIIEFKKKINGSITILTGIDFSITDPEALKELLNLDVSCNIIYKKNFHPKLYIFERNSKNATVIIGSSNLSKGGLNTNHEANLILDGDISELPIHDAIEYFSYLYKISVPLDNKIIELYNKSKIIFDDIRNKVTENDKINEVAIELNEYLNQKSQNDSFSELSESDYKEMLFAEEKSDEGLVLYEKGNLSDAYNLLNESYDIYQKLEKKYDYIIAQKANVLLNIGWTLFNLSKLEEARKRIDEMELILSSTDNKVDLLSAIGLNAIVMNGNKDAMKKCNKFIEMFESNKNSLKNKLSPNIIGLVYSDSAKYHFSKKILNIAYKHCIYSIEYFKQCLESANDDFSRMIANLNLGTAYSVEDNIKPTPDFNNNTIRQHYETALEIAINKLKSDFWEAKIMVYLAGAPSYQYERCHHLKKAKKIFMKLNHMELVSEINEMIKSYGC